MSLLIDADFIVYKCCAGAETEIDFGEDLKFKLELSAVMAGEYYNLRVPIAAEGKIGSTWADVH